MHQLHIFNPSHDEALAAHSPFYYPAKAARTLGADLAVLPAWWAKAGDWVLVPEEVALPATDFTQQGVHFTHPSQLKKLFEEQNICKIQPWGWDALLVHQLQKAGVPDSVLPHAQQLEKIRELSSRATAVSVLSSLRKELPLSVGESFICTEEEKIWELTQQYGQVMLKAPWSSSGRGVFTATKDAPDNIRQRVNRILKEQGAVELEPFYHRLTDFALEFYATAEDVIYEGLSIFDTSETGAYTGNVVAQEPALVHHLPANVQKQLPDVVSCLRQQLHMKIGKDYEGPLGVDLMCVLQDDGTTAIHPCIEVNLRNTMGHVALHLRSLLSDNSTGVYHLCPVNRMPAEAQVLTPGSQKIAALFTIEKPELSLLK